MRIKGGGGHGGGGEQSLHIGDMVEQQPDCMYISK